MNKQSRLLQAGRVLAALQARYPQPKSQLRTRNAWELLVATVLAAQCTDERVNLVTPRLFQLWPGPAEMAQASQESVEEVIHSTGFFRNKAKNLRGAAQRICDVYGGTVPDSLAELVTLPGVARKTANIVLFGAYGINEGFAVDTHVKRISFRLGLTAALDPTAVERDLMELFPQEEWGNLNHRLVWFGREVCSARKPQCTACELQEHCPRLEPPKKSRKKASSS
jgi:endonuclease-3